MKKIKRGQTLVETLVALGVLTLVFTAAFSAMNFSSKAARLSREKMQAIGYAQDALEKIRNIRDSNQKYASNHPGTKAYNENFTNGQVKIVQNGDNFEIQPTGSLEDMSEPKFKRRVDIIGVSPTNSYFTINVTVTWPNGGSFSTGQQLSDWRKN